MVSTNVLYWSDGGLSTGLHYILREYFGCATCTIQELTVCSNTTTYDFCRFLMYVDATHYFQLNGGWRRSARRYLGSMNC